MNPYQPPEASLDDPVAPKIVRPPEVSRACRILWIVLIVGLVSLLPAIRGEWWQWQPPEMTEIRVKNTETASLISFIPLIVFVAFMTAINGLLIWLTSQHHNWARWVFLAYLVFGWYSTTAALSQTFSTTPFAAVIDLFCIMAEIWATYLLFLGPGGRWFKAAPPAAQSSPRM